MGLMPASLRFLKVGLISTIPPRFWHCFLYTILVEGGESERIPFASKRVFFSVKNDGPQEVLIEVVKTLNFLIK